MSATPNSIGHHFRPDTRAVQRCYRTAPGSEIRRGFGQGLSPEEARTLAKTLTDQTPSPELRKEVAQILQNCGYDVEPSTVEKVLEKLLSGEQPGLIVHNGGKQESAHKESQAQPEDKPQRTKIIDLSQDPDLIEDWIEEIGELMWDNYYQNLNEEERRKGYVFHCPDEEEWEGLEERIKAAEHFYILIDRSTEEDQLMGFVEMKPFAKELLERMQHIKGKIHNLLNRNIQYTTHLQLIVIAEKYRGKGVGKRLHKYAKRKAQEERKKFMILEVPIVPDENLISRQFHRDGLKMTQIAHTFEPEPDNPDAMHVFEIYLTGLQRKTRQQVKSALNSKRRRKRHRR